MTAVKKWYWRPYFRGGRYYKVQHILNRGKTISTIMLYVRQSGQRRLRMKYVWSHRVVLLDPKVAED